MVHRDPPSPVSIPLVRVADTTAGLGALATHVRGRVRYLRRLLRSLDIAALESRLGAVTAPTIILHGDHDRLVPLSVARTLADRIGGAELRVLRHTGHSPHLEEPWAVRAAIREALQLAALEDELGLGGSWVA